MQNRLFLLLFLLNHALSCLGSSHAELIFEKSPNQSPPPDSTTQNLDSLAISTLQGWMNFLRAVHTDNCLPRNEAWQSELDSNKLQSDYFVPNQLGYWMLTAILSHEVKKDHPELTAGFDKSELLAKLSCTMDALEGIIENHTFLDPATGKKALYQVYKTDGTAPLGTGFEQTVSMLDNLYLITALHAVASWADGLDNTLANRIRSSLTAFDLSMWEVKNVWHIGGPLEPVQGPVDRFVSESRLVYPAALARGEIDLGQMICAINSALSQSQPYVSAKGTTIEYLPFFGRALEKWVPTVFLPIELNTRFGCKSLYPLVEAQEEVACINALPTNEATPIGDGNFSFKEFSIGPSESDFGFQNYPVLIPPAVAMQAGVMAQTHPLAACNFYKAMQSLSDASQLSILWGPPNYLDFGTGLVNSNDPLRSTLEIEQGALALLNMLLGGEYLEGLLRKDTAWNTAIDDYAATLNRQTWLREAETNALGDGVIRVQGNACSERTWKLLAAGDTVTYTININTAGNYQLQIRYSNDDLGIGDKIHLLVDGALKNTFQSEDTGNGGAGWNTFVLSPGFDLGLLDSGSHTISLVLSETDGFGIEFDALILRGDFDFNCDYQSKSDTCCLPLVGVAQAGLPIQKVEAFPNPFSSSISIAFQLQTAQHIVLRLFDMNGTLVQTLGDDHFGTGKHTVEWSQAGLPQGLYILTILGDTWAMPPVKLIMLKPK